MKKILGVNISHNVSFSYFKDNVLKEYYEEDRFNKIKHFYPPHPFFEQYEYEVLKKFKDIVFDAVVFVSFDRGDPLIDKAYIDNILKQVATKNVKFYNNQHHVFHAISGFYFSKFDEAIGLVCDGGGEIYHTSNSINFRVMESIFYINKNKIKCFYKHYSCGRNDFWENFHKIPSEKNFKENNIDIILSNKICCGYKFNLLALKANFNNHEEGQLMGIAAYKKKHNLNNNVLKIAKKAQKETLDERIALVEKAITYNDCKNIILSGGYHLNCANNFKLVKHFPKLNFFVDPIAHDGGTSVGAAYNYIKYEENFKN